MTFYRNFHVYCLVSIYKLTNYVSLLRFVQKAQLLLFLANSVYFMHDQFCRLYVGIHRHVRKVLKVVYHQFDFCVSESDIVKRVCNKTKDELYEIEHRNRFTTHCLELVSDKANLNLTLWYEKEEMIEMIETMAMDKQWTMRHKKEEVMETKWCFISTSA